MKSTEVAFNRDDESWDAAVLIRAPCAGDHVTPGPL
jgi:hypothetical protein